MLYGVPDAPLHIYKPSKEDTGKHDPDGKIVEFPMTVLRIGTNIDRRRILPASSATMVLKSRDKKCQEDETSYNLYPSMGDVSKDTEIENSVVPKACYILWDQLCFEEV